MAILENIRPTAPKINPYAVGTAVAGVAGSAITANSDSKGGAAVGGALSGASAGASLGLTLGGPAAPIAAAFGAIAGGISGAIKYKKEQEDLAKQNFLTNVNSKPNPSIFDVASSQYGGGGSNTYLGEKFGIQGDSGILNNIQNI